MSEQTTLRDQLEAAFGAQDDQETDTGAEVQASTEVQPEVQTPEVQETPEQKAQRERDQRGRFVAKQGEQQSQQAQQPEQQAQQPAQQPKPRPQRPSTWKKDVADRFWEQIDPDLADYINLREQQFAQGVSTYKQEWERVKPLSEALQPFMPILQQHQIDPAQWITNLGTAHRMLATGNPEQKAMWFRKLAHDYGVSLEGNGGGDPAIGAFVNELQTLKQELNHFKTSAQRQEEERTKSEIATWSNGKPHFDKVRETMAQLLESGVATDLNTAYDKAIRLHDDVWEAEQQERARTAEEERRRQQAETVARAKANAVSVKGATPAAVSKATQAKGLRAQLEAAASEILPSRV